MGLDSTINTFANINNILGSTVGYTKDKAQGASTGEAVMNFGFNVLNGGIRNMTAKEILNNTGSYIGYSINSTAGYGSAEANEKGTQQLMAASLFTSPYGIFGGYMNPYMMNPFGGSIFTGGMFGGCGCSGMSYGFGPQSFFMNRGFYC